MANNEIGTNHFNQLARIKALEVLKKLKERSRCMMCETVEQEYQGKTIIRQFYTK